MEYNESLKGVVALIYSQCKEEDCGLLNVNKIIEYLNLNFDLNPEEADQLKISNLFDLLKNEGNDNKSRISEDQFERVLQLWIPSVQPDRSQSLSDNSTDDDMLFAGSVRNRLSRSLTNLKQHIDQEREQKLSFCRSWVSNNMSNDENLFQETTTKEERRSLSPCGDPFTVPLGFIKSTPYKRRNRRSTKFYGVQQPNLRYKKLHQFDQNGSYSDSDAFLPGDGSFLEDYSSENCSSNKDVDVGLENIQKRNRKSEGGRSEFQTEDNNDLLSQLKQIKFKNKQLVDINDRLQIQLEGVEETLRNLNSKCCNLEKKTKLCNSLSEENKQFIIEIDDIRKSLEKETEAKKSLLCEKIMTEGELSVSKSHIQSLIDKLSLLDSGLEEKDRMIGSLKAMISEQQEFCSKLQELNMEKDDELVKNEKSMIELTKAINVYEEKIDILVREKEIFQRSRVSVQSKDNPGLMIDKPQSNLDVRKVKETGCSAGLDTDNHDTFTTCERFRPSIINSPWSINVEIAKQLVDSSGDNPFCEKLFLNDDESEDSSFKMLQELSKILSSLRMTLAEYREQLESASITMKSNEHFVDEISLSYISHLDDSINLLAASTDKATRCQNQFNETYEFLMKRISNLKNERKILILKNEQLQLQIGDSSNNVETSEKICFLEDELRRERFACTRKQKIIQDLEQFKEERMKFTRCINCGRCSVRFSINSEMYRKHLATEALNLERDKFNEEERYVDLEKTQVYNQKDSWDKSNGNFNRKSSLSVDQLLNQKSPDEDDLTTQNDDLEFNTNRDYYISTDDLASTPRYKLSKVQPTEIEIDQIIENSWLETHSNMEERRASVFAQISNVQLTVDNTVSSAPSPDGSVFDQEKPVDKIKKRTRNGSSSCSSSNDTSDANSIDVTFERRKLAKELEMRTIRLQSRSPVPSTLTITDDMKSITPTVNEEEQIRIWQNNTDYSEVDGVKNDSRNNSPTSVMEEFSATESVSMDIPISSRKSSLTRSSVIINVCDVTPTLPFVNDSTLSNQSLPTISIVEVPTNECTANIGISNATEPNSTEDAKPPLIKSSVSKAMTVESEGNSLQASMNKSAFSSRASSVAGDDSKLIRKSKQSNKRVRRPYTVAGINLNNSKISQDDTSSNCEEQSNVGDCTDIQASIDLLQEMKDTLSHISPEELENKFSEMSLIYRTDRPTVIDRAKDANKKCNKALTNVEQEFNILRHLIKSVVQVVEQPCEFVPRIKASISVLEKCVEYLSAKSEIFGAVEQEIKMSSVIDVMNEYNNKLIKEREEHLRELEEVKLWRESTMDMCTNGSIDQTRPKRNLMAGKKLVSKVEHHERYSCQSSLRSYKSKKEHRLTLRHRSISDSSLWVMDNDPKTRFQMLAKNTVLKSSIVRQLTGSNFNRQGHLSSFSENNGALDSPNSEHKFPFRKGASSQSIDILDSSKKGSDNEASVKSRKYTGGIFFSSTEENGESLYQKGLQQGLRINADHALTEMRAEQSKFSSNLDSLSDMIEEYDPLQEDVNIHGANIDKKLVAIKEKMSFFCKNFKIALKKSVYICVGFVVILALLIPWLLTPASPPTSSFSIPVSRQRVKSSVDTDDIPSPSSTSSSSPSFFNNVNLVRHQPATV